MSKKAVAVIDQPSEVATVIAEAFTFAVTGIREVSDVKQALVLASELEEFQVNAASALDQATRLVITDNRTQGLGGDILKAINAQIRNVDEARLGRTRKIDTFKTAFAGLFSPAATTLTKAKALVGDKINEWGRAEQKRLRDEAAAAQKESEDRALALAAAQAALGDQKGADQIIDQAAETIEKTPEVRATVRGNFGSTTSSTRRYDGEVTDVRAFVTWLLAQPKGDISNVIDFKKAGLNSVAKAFDGKEVPGFLNKSRDDFGAR